MKLTVLGSGAFVPTRERNNSSFLLEADGKRILLDAGFGSVKQMVNLGVDPQSIDWIFVSHFHADHCGDVFPLIQARYVDDLYHGRTTHKPLTIIGPTTVKERYQQWRKIFWPEPQETHDYLEFREGVRPYQWGKIKMTTFRVHHVPWFESVGIRIEDGEKMLVYTGDIGSDHPWDDLVQQTKNADLLMIEAGHKKPTPNHWTIEQTKKLMQAAQIKKTLLVHNRADMLALTQQQMAGCPTLVLAEDGMSVII